MLLLTLPAMAETEGWIDIPRPNNDKGLVMQPRLCGVRSRLHLVFAGTSEEIRRPEFFHASMSDGDDKLGDARPPFFGMALSRVRRVAIGNARHMLGVIFQRSLTQSSDAYELLLSLSADHGWSWSRPYVIDSFVHEESGGSWVSIDGREGTNRPEFAVAWAADGNQVRAANIDINSNRRPRGASLGTHAPDSKKVEVASVGRNGFVVVWSEGEEIKTARIKGLVGGVEPARTLTKGRFGQMFTLAGSPKGPARGAAIAGGKMTALSTEGKKWETVTTDPVTVSAQEVRSDMDDDKRQHLALFTGGTNAKVYYFYEKKDGKFTEPELVLELDPNIPCMGFDVGVTNDYVYLIASQGNRVHFKRRKMKKD